jgi:hypothetical protein
MSELLFPLATAASLSLAEVAEKTGINPSTLQKKCKAGLMPGAFQVGVADAGASSERHWKIGGLARPGASASIPFLALMSSARGFSGVKRPHYAQRRSGSDLLEADWRLSIGGPSWKRVTWSGSRISIRTSGVGVETLNLSEREMSKRWLCLADELTTACKSD